MHKLVTLAVAGLAAGWLTLATPSASQAQGISFGFQIQRGGPACGPTKGYYPRGYDTFQPDYRDFDRGFDPHRGSRFDGGRDCFPQRPVIVPPEYRPCTPGHGRYEHGPIGVPQRGYYPGYRY